MTLDEQKMIDECMDYFNFEKVHKVMEFLDWKWGNVNITGKAEVPSIPELRQSARRYLRTVIEEGKHEEQYFTFSGGLKATAYRDAGKLTHLDLEFVLTDWSVDHEG